VLILRRRLHRSLSNVLSATAGDLSTSTVPVITPRPLLSRKFPEVTQPWHRPQEKSVDHNCWDDGEARREVTSRTNMATQLQNNVLFYRGLIYTVMCQSWFSKSN